MRGPYQKSYNCFTTKNRSLPTATLFQNWKGVPKGTSLSQNLFH